ncbi:hypothetical protein [Ochrobactrum sp. SFR4]|uniref:hypothetical protein n=1 Tax=Ochrobactrum sp. SFR4 TaxID=2717368 RepID=UPI001C8BC3F2|nr:hypothetical protein [Ochrobactrum sp. SFR4]MBX8826258.1 hypothetical protein [Ochrobactrum sp. SFR4]
MTYQTSVTPVVHVSRPVQFLRDKTAGAAAVIARLFSAKETGPRDKILLFFSVMYQTLFHAPEAAVKKGSLILRDQQEITLPISMSGYLISKPVAERN